MWYPHTAESKVNFSMHDDQRMPRPCPRLLPTFKAWLLSTRSFVRKLYGVFQSDNLEKSGQKSILSWRCHKFKRKRRYSKWNFAFFRLDKCVRWQKFLRRCFKTLIVFPCLLIANTTLLAFQTLLFLFFSKICASKLGVRLIYGCGLYMDLYGSFTC